MLIYAAAYPSPAASAKDAFDPALGQTFENDTCHMDRRPLMSDSAGGSSFDPFPVLQE